MTERTAAKITVSTFAGCYDDQVHRAVTVWFVDQYGETIHTSHDLTEFDLVHLMPEYKAGRTENWVTLGGLDICAAGTASKRLKQEIQEALGDPSQYRFDVKPTAGCPRWLREELEDARIAAQIPQNI